MNKLPKRDKTHISESKSLRILRNAIPDNWILREITERDYGIDCYLELVNNDNQLTGDLISLKVKSKERINWNTNKIPNATEYKIKIETTNYWNSFIIPVILLLVDIELEEIYMIPVKEYIRQSYLRYLEQDKFHYTFRKDYQLKKDTEHTFKFIMLYFTEKNRIYFETNMLRFFNTIKRDREFIEENIGRDIFMGIEIEREIELKGIIQQIHDLCQYFWIDVTVK